MARALDRVVLQVPVRERRLLMRAAVLGRIERVADAIQGDDALTRRHLHHVVFLELADRGDVVPPVARHQTLASASAGPDPFAPLSCAAGGRLCRWTSALCRAMSSRRCS